MAMSGFNFVSVIPNFSERSCSSPLGKLQSNECKREAKMNNNIFSANGKPGHNLLPEPNGKKFKLFPLYDFFASW
ncbi:hypothetical protein HanPSC8_Chr03g0084841 [Helianthus annuus]|nr:hypothetical protein HanPSC8_Chr03g0084841 [Helianthus annuus]